MEKQEERSLVVWPFKSFVYTYWNSLATTPHRFLKSSFLLRYNLYTAMCQVLGVQSSELYAYTPVATTQIKV